MIDVFTPIRSDWDDKVGGRPLARAEVARGMTGEPVQAAPAAAGADRAAVIVALDGWVDAGSAATNAAATLAQGGARRRDVRRGLDLRLPRAPADPRDRARPARAASSGPSSRSAPRRSASATSSCSPAPSPTTAGTSWRPTSSRSPRSSASRSGSASARSRPPCPHTRPVPILGTESRSGQLKGGVLPGPEGVLRVPAAAISVFDISVAQGGHPVGRLLRPDPALRLRRRTRRHRSSCCSRSGGTWTWISTSGACPRRRAYARPPRRRRGARGDDARPTSSGWRRWSTRPACRRATT